MAQLSNQMQVFDYKDVRLIPAQTVLSSRSEADTTITLNDITFKVPVVPANMSSVMDENLAKLFAEKNYFYVMHRFDIDSVAFTQTMHDAGLYASISLGVQKADEVIIEELSKLARNPEFVTIDVAHGHSEVVASMVRKVKSALPDTYIIAGNVGTSDGANFLAAAGAHAIKCGVAPGLACTTGPNTGFGTRDYQLSAIKYIAENLDYEVQLIADGGIREYGDIAKSIAFGADLVMIGGMFAGHDESPGETIINEAGEKVKAYFGSASAQQKGNDKHVEGKSMYLPAKGSVFNTLRIIEENLQSSISYGGVTKVSDLFNVEYVLVNR